MRRKDLCIFPIMGREIQSTVLPGKERFYYGYGCIIIDHAGGSDRNRVLPERKRRSCFNPVSYTHLDVYKRQVQKNCSSDAG